MICPCKECENQGCGAYHSECEKFAGWQEWRSEGIRRRMADADNRQISRNQEMKYRRNLKQGRNRR